MKNTRQPKNHQKMWQFMRKKELDAFLTPKPQPQSTGLSRHRNAINAFFSELNAQVLPDTIQANAHLDINLNAIHQMAAITAEIIAPLFVDMPDYAGDYIHIFEN